jgi:hypothetical protein
MEKQRRHFTAEEKVKVLRRHLVEKVAAGPFHMARRGNV